MTIVAYSVLISIDMAIGQYKDITNSDSNGLNELEKPFIEHKKVGEYDDLEANKIDEGGSITMVLLPCKELFDLVTE